MFYKKPRSRIVILLSFLFLIGICVILYKLPIRQWYMMSNKTSEIILDKTYVINLDRTPERYDEMQKKLANTNLQYEKFSAIDGYKLKIKYLDCGTGIAANGEYDEEYFGSDLKTHALTPKYRYTITGEREETIGNSTKSIQLPMQIYHNTMKPRTLAAGAMGCMMSHRSIWEKVLNSDQKAVLILEDDAVFHKDFNNILNDVLKNAPSDWDVIYLGYYTNSLKSIPTKNKKFQRLIKFVYTTHGYIVNRKACAMLLKNTTEVSKPIDHYIDPNVLNVYATTEKIITQDLQGSVSAQME